MVDDFVRIAGERQAVDGSKVPMLIHEVLDEWFDSQWILAETWGMDADVMDAIPRAPGGG